MIYVDPMGETLGYEDVFTKIDMCKRHYEAVGLGADYVQRYIRQISKAMWVLINEKHQIRVL